MIHTDMMETVERQQDSDAGQADMLQALRSAALPDDFWMYNYKILPCPHGYRHSWTHCPFSHVGETARRRCPRTHSYLPDPCVNARAKRQCPNGDACPYAHNTFEQWLHPSRYRTRLCYLGANCRRPTCFFAHSVEELRSVDENESGGAPAMLPPLPPLPVPPPLPSPSPSGVMAGSGSGVDFGAVSPAMQPTGGAPGGGAPHLPAVPGGPPMGLLQPVVLMGIPQPLPQQHHHHHQALRSDMMPPHGAVQCYVPYQPRPTMLRPPMPLQADSQSATQQMQMHLQMHPSGAVPVAVRSPAPAVRPQHLPPQHLANPTTVAVAAVHHHPGPFVYLHSNMPTSMSTGAAMHGPPPPPPPPMPMPQGYSSPFVTPAGFHRGVGGEGVPPSMCPPSAGRVRSWSNPGETAYLVSAAPALGGGGGSRTQGGGGPPMWASANAGHHVAVPPPSGAPMAPSMRSTGHGGGGGGRGGGSGVASAAPRHMPAPTNRGGALRRISSPADSSPPMAAALAAAAVTALHYPDQPGSPGGSPGLRARASAPSGSQQRQQQMPSGSSSVEAALRALALTKPVAAPPPTPSHLGGSYSPSHSASSSSSSSPQSMSAAVSSPVASMALSNDTAAAPMNAAAAAAAAARVNLAIMCTRPSVGGGAASSSGGSFSRPSSAGSGRSGSTVMSLYDSSSAAAALAAVTAGIEAPGEVTMPYSTLLQHVLRSASASVAEPSSGLLPALFTGSDAVHAVHADLYYDDDVADVAERSSDPGPGGLRAAIRRISSEFGSAAACRNSDPGHNMPTAGSPQDVQQLLLPLLQSVLTEGLATGQFELVNGQLQMKSSGGGAAKPGAVGPLSVESAPACVAGPGVNA